MVHPRLKKDGPYERYSEEDAMSLRFEWNDHKARTNFQKHGVDFVGGHGFQ